MTKSESDLPNELLSQMSKDCLAIGDLHSLILTSKRFRSFTIPWLYHTFDTRTPRRKRRRGFSGKSFSPVVGGFVRAIV